MPRGVEHLQRHAVVHDHAVGPAHHAVAALADRLRNADRDIGPEIGAQQHILDIVEHGGIELALGDEVSDRGPGIPEDQLERVLAPFARTESAMRSGVTGSGLGLAIVKRTIEALGGRLTLANRDGGGLAAKRRARWIHAAAAAARDAAAGAAPLSRPRSRCAARTSAGSTAGP